MFEYYNYYDKVSDALITLFANSLKILTFIQLIRTNVQGRYLKEKVQVNLKTIGKQ